MTMGDNRAMKFNMKTLDEIQENARLLRSCARHMFEFPRSRDEYIQCRRVGCKHCGGHDSKERAIAYARGAVAAGANETDVLVDGFPLQGDWIE